MYISVHYVNVAFDYPFGSPTRGDLAPLCLESVDFLLICNFCALNLNIINILIIRSCILLYSLVFFCPLIRFCF